MRRSSRVGADEGFKCLQRGTTDHLDEAEKEGTKASVSGARYTPKTLVRQVPKSTSGHQVSQVRISSVFREMTFKMSKGGSYALRS